MKFYRFSWKSYEIPTPFGGIADGRTDGCRPRPQPPDPTNSELGSGPQIVAGSRFFNRHYLVRMAESQPDPSPPGMTFRSRR